MPKHSIVIYGIKNCDTMKRARAWLDDNGVEYQFHDYKAEGVELARVEEWVKELGWETVLNRSGMTFRNLPDSEKEGLNARKAVSLMVAQPSMIKRPILDIGAARLAGFKPDIYADAFKKASKKKA